MQYEKGDHQYQKQIISIRCGTVLKTRLGTSEQLRFVTR